MEKFFVYLPMTDYSAGCMDHGVLVDAETTEEAIVKGGMGHTLGFPDTAPAAAVQVPDHLSWLPAEEQLEYYMGLAEALDEKDFYRKVMNVRRYKPASRPDCIYYIGDLQVSEEEWKTYQKSIVHSS